MFESIKNIHLVNKYTNDNLPNMTVQTHAEVQQKQKSDSYSYSNKINKPHSLKLFFKKGRGVLSIALLTLMIPIVGCEQRHEELEHEDHEHEEHEDHEHEEHEEHEHEEHEEHGHEEHEEHEHEEHEDHEHEEHEDHEHEEHEEHGHEEHEDDKHTTASTHSAIDNQDINTSPASIGNKTEIAISNYPLFLLSEAVTKGAPSGHLLFDSSDGGHHASLSPGDIKTIKDSRYVVWFGPELETNLAKPFAKTPNSISLLGLNGFDLKPLRDIKGQPIAGSLDPHIWLDPENAKAITRALGAIYSRANPQYKAVYEANVKEFATKMNDAVNKVKPSTTTQVRPYWAYHDSFQYIEPTLKLNMVGTLTSDEHLPPKASQLLWLKQSRPEATKCLLMQSKNYESVISKLKPIQSVVQSEDMSESKEFIPGWLSLANNINKTC